MKATCFHFRVNFPFNKNLSFLAMGPFYFAKQYNNNLLPDTTRKNASDACPHKRTITMLVCSGWLLECSG